MFVERKKNETMNLINTLTLSQFFNEGLIHNRNQKLKLRKDLGYIFNPKGKSPVSRNFNPISRIPKSTPYFEIKGLNLFELSFDEVVKLDNIYKLKFNETKDLELEKLSYLPCLNTLIVQFSSVIYWNDFYITNQSSFPYLEHLDLAFNGLTSDIFNYLKKIKMLRVLNLLGNYFDIEICDLSEMANLEELNLSHNKIESFYLNNSFSFTKENSKSLILKREKMDSEIQLINENRQEIKDLNDLKYIYNK